MRFCFVTASRGNRFMTELLEGLAAAVRAAGHAAEVVPDEFPDHGGIDAYVAIPHELHGTVTPAQYPSQEQCARTIALCTENPGNEWFEALPHLLPHFAACAAVNRASADALARRGVACRHMQLGYLPAWDLWQGRPDGRPIDVVYLGAADQRRDAILASLGQWLNHRQVRVLRPPAAPKSESRGDFVSGAEKYALLGSAKVLINLHREGTRNFEWLRYLEAASNGCVVVSEPSLDADRLVPGEHLLVAAADAIPLVVDRLIADPGALETLRHGAYQFIREQLTMSSAAEVLVELAGQLPRRPAGARAGVRTTLPDPPVAEPSRPVPDATPLAEWRAAVLEMREVRRELGSLAYRVRTGEEPEVKEVLRTPSYEDARPRVSVAITVHNYAREVVDALTSVAASDFDALEVLVLDDASTDGSRAAVAGFLEATPWLPAALMCHPVNRGLARSRNALTARARGEYVFILDADNGVYPPALSALVAALDDDPGASFAYSMIAELDPDGRPLGLLSAYPWEPQRLSGGNYIDAMALLRRRDLLALGGYCTDPRLLGWDAWEDFELWCRCAESGRYGVLVPSVLAWYRHWPQSMLREASASASAAWWVMRRRFPDLLGAPNRADEMARVGVGAP